MFSQLILLTDADDPDESRHRRPWRRTPVGWYAQDSGVTEDLNAVAAVDAFTAWSVGDNGTILKTINGGD